MKTKNRKKMTSTGRLNSAYFKKVENKWNDKEAKGMDPLARLVYRSNLLGRDAYITNTGGGNTSCKIVEKDPVTGDEVNVLCVKGSGGDLRTATKKNFASLYQDKLLSLQEVYGKFENRGLKTPAEDAMVQMYLHCTFNLNPCAPSIDTPLHSFIPYASIDHTHPIPVISIATAHNGQKLTEEIYGNEVVWVDWMRPGFELGLKLQETVKNNPGLKGIILGGHGLINWADDDRECYTTTLDLINKAADFLADHNKAETSFGGLKYQALADEKRDDLLTEILPFIRGNICRRQRSIGTIQHDALTLQFVNSVDAPQLAELGTSCPDHFLRTKIKPLYVEWNAAAGNVDELRSEIKSDLEKYRLDYEDYYNSHKRNGSPDIRTPDPTVILIPGVGMITWGKNKSESRVTAEFYHAAIGVMSGSESVGTYTALTKQEAFDIEYWALEEAKLKRQPAERELSRQIIAVIGAGSGIGRALTGRLLNEGATVAALDIDGEAVRKTVQEQLNRIGTGVGAGGSGISASGDVIGLNCDMTNSSSVRDALEKIILAYGGLDSIAITAGFYPVPDEDGNISEQDWDKSYAVNVKGIYNIAREARRILREQGLKGNIVITTSANAVVPKIGNMAYDTSKSAANHLVRELAIELAPMIRVNGVAPATVIEGSSMFPRDRIIASLSKYNIPFKEDDSIDVLRDKLANFYSNRTLLKKPVSLSKQVEAIFLLLSSRFENTTGHIIPVDGGLTEAFLR
jgi:rhamnulose-1-phosphate aldolase/alcohol dehydrogenase